MASRLHIEGTWPGSVSITRSWAKAHARPWNDETPDALVRLERGGAAFLGETSDRLAELSGHSVYSPAVFESTARIWRRTGYRPAVHLNMMERSLGRPSPSPRSIVETTETPDWHALARVDNAAFDGFWRMGVDGLRETMDASSRSIAITSPGPDGPAGFAVIALQWGVSYLQRIAVHPDYEGNGLGTDLLRAAMLWGRRQSAPVMVLNVRPENERAIALYQREGFTTATDTLHVFRYEH